MPLLVKRWSVLAFVFASVALPFSIAIAAVEWQVIKINGHDYLSVDNISKFYGLPAEVIPSGAKIQSETANHPLEFVSGSREAMRLACTFLMSPSRAFRATKSTWKSS